MGGRRSLARTFLETLNPILGDTETVINNKRRGRASEITVLDGLFESGVASN